MTFFKRVAGYLGFGHETNDHNHPHHHHHHHHNNRPNNSDKIRHNRTNVDPIPTGPRKGFSVPVQLPLDRQVVGPILYPCAQRQGGVQVSCFGKGIGGYMDRVAKMLIVLMGLRWYAGSLKSDEDGDVANEFLYEFSAGGMSRISQDRVKPRFLANRNLRRAEIKQQRMRQDGKLECCVECQGQLVWI